MYFHETLFPCKPEEEKFSRSNYAALKTYDSESAEHLTGISIFYFAFYLRQETPVLLRAGEY